MTIAAPTWSLLLTSRITIATSARAATAKPSTLAAPLRRRPNQAAAPKINSSATTKRTRGNSWNMTTIARLSISGGRTSAAIAAARWVSGDLSRPQLDQHVLLERTFAARHRMLRPPADVPP